MLEFFYHGAFDATAETRNLVVGEGRVYFETPAFIAQVGALD